MRQARGDGARLRKERRVQILAGEITRRSRYFPGVRDLPRGLRHQRGIDGDRRNRERGLGGAARRRQLHRERLRTPGHVGIEHGAVDVAEIHVMPLAEQLRHRGVGGELVAVVFREQERLDPLVVAAETEIVELLGVMARRQVDRGPDLELVADIGDAGDDGAAQILLRRRQEILEDHVGLVEAGLRALGGDEHLDRIHLRLGLERLNQIGLAQVVGADIGDGRRRRQIEIVIADHAAQDHLAAERRRHQPVGVVRGVGFHRDTDAIAFLFPRGRERGVRADEGTAADAAVGGELGIGVIAAAQLQRRRKLIVGERRTAAESGDRDHKPTHPTHPRHGTTQRNPHCNHYRRAGLRRTKFGGALRSDADRFGAVIPFRSAQRQALHADG